MRIIMLGAPGSGKGTQTQLLSKYFYIPFISAGEILRQESKKNEKTKSYIENKINQGKLVNNSFIINLIKKKIKKKNCFNKFILDGFPRTIKQAESLKKHIKMQFVIHLKISTHNILNRITGRLIHTSSGRTYHKTFNPPKRKNKDDLTGELLSKRKDDDKKIIITRLEEYRKLTTPLIDWFKKEDLKQNVKYIEINANKSIHEINKKIILYINKNNKK
ncbi:Adenylate kinase [Buchnera aphidicola (Cinara pseudotaxifoliae)]|uniref:Adenylate kinase n=1 Tax=Buchnera aphidicola (Cinara pseudotaxifoliae) TaxID=655384 RepID=A0A451DHN6_9GAMM|nr:nucleoside monophosphate kinase [Buchnera aphidicola]VFP86123.1 Adenylate kinase [Buchnera aphidicola (Cinara pseudotaxifoliae)]